MQELNDWLKCLCDCSHMAEKEEMKIRQKSIQTNIERELSDLVVYFQPIPFDIDSKLFVAVRTPVLFVCDTTIEGLKRTHTLVVKSRLMPMLWPVTSPTKGATACPIACALAEYHTQQML